MLPNFVVIGAQKSASTFLHRCLNDHPDVFLPPGETPFFESPDFETSSVLDLERLFEGCTEKKLGIKRPNYLGKPEVPPRIARTLPSAKLLAVLRNPVDRAISAYYHRIRSGFLPPVDIEIGMPNVILDPSFSDAFPRTPEIIEFGRYHKYLKLYHDFKVAGRLHVTLHDDVEIRPLDCVQKAYRFLGVTSGFVPPSLHQRPQAVVYSLKRLRWLRLRNPFLFDYNRERTRLFAKKPTKVGRIVVRLLNEVDRRVLMRLLGNKKPAISQRLRELLFEQYETDIDLLERYLNTDLSSWKMSRNG